MDLFENSGFGRLDPSHLGVWLNVDVALRHADFARFGPLMWSTFHFQPGKKHLDYLKLAPPEQTGEIAACFSLFEHEARHFHDLLATPYGSMLMRQYTRASLYFCFLQDELYFRTNGFVVPIEDWISAGATLRQAFHGVDLPSKTVSDFASVFKTMADKLYQYNRGLSNTNDHRFPDATSILEGSAMAVQERCIFERFGKQSLNAFRQGLVGRPAYRKYYGAIRLIQLVAERAVHPEVVSFLLFCSLCGNFQDPTPDRFQYPTDILLELLSWLKQEQYSWGYSESFEDLIDLVDGYFEATHGGDLISLLTQAPRANKGVLEALEEELAKYQELSGRECRGAREVLDRFLNYCEVQGNLLGAIITDPSWYCSSTYDEIQRMLPTPVVFVESEIGIPITAELESVYYIQAENRIYVPSLPDELTRHAESLADGRKRIRAAHILSPRIQALSSAAIPGQSIWATYLRSSPAINVDLWQKCFDITAGLRLVLEGPSTGMSQHTVRDVVGSFAIFGTRVFTSQGEIVPVLPDLTDGHGPAVEPFLNLLRESKATKKH